MVARTHKEPDGLVLRFERDGDRPEHQHAPGGRDALLLAIGMLIARDHLLVGDRLSVLAGTADDGDVIDNGIVL
jgi:hypothetical protein